MKCCQTLQMMAHLSSSCLYGSIWIFLLVLLFVQGLETGTLSDSGIKGPPHITGPVAPRQTFRLGETIKLECPIHGIPSPILEWLKDDESITAGWGRFKSTNHGLRIKDAILDDSGTYTCKGVNGFGSEQISFEVIIVDPNASSTEAPSIFGSHEADYIDSDGTWKKQLIGTAPQFNETNKSSDTFLQLAIDSTLRLKCLAHGEPEPRIRWFKDNKEILDDRRSDRWGLQVNGVHIEDSGVYTCKAENHFGSINASFHVKIIDPAQQKPEFVGHYPQNVTVMEGTTARLQCRVISQQSPFIQWLKKLERVSSYDLHTDHRYLQQNGIIRVDGWIYRVLRAGKPAFQADDGSYLDKLALDHVTLDDAGTYVCAATNSIGYNYREAFVNVYSGSTTKVSNTLPTAAVVALPIGSVAIVALIAWIIYYVKTERRLQSRKESRRLEQQRHGDGNKDLSLTAPCLPNGDQESLSNNRLPLPNNIQPNYMPYSTPYMEPIQQTKILQVYPKEVYPKEALRMHNSGNIRHTPRPCTSPSVTGSGSNPYHDPNSTVSCSNWSSVYRPPPCGRSPGLNHSVVSYPVESADSEHAYATVHNMNVNYSPYEDSRYNNHRRFMKRIDMV